LITARDMAIPPAGPLPAAPPLQAPPAYASAALVAPLRERLLLIVLYLTVLTSSVAFIEPSPHDALIFVLAVAGAVAGLHFDRKIVTLFLLLLIFNTAGLASLLNVVDQDKTIQYAATSIYLAIAAVLWACLLGENTVARMASLRSAYILTAVIAAIIGMIGYFNAFPGAEELLATGGRARGLFKDPNVYAPFLIWPTLVLLQRMLTDRIRFADLAAAATIMFALLLAFSRGAWFHFGLSAVVMIALAFLTAPTPGKRMRIFTLSAIAIVALTVVVVVLLSLPAIHAMFEERAHLVQSYDVGQGGRFRLQELALAAVLKFPNGMGPFGFASTHANQQHNVYLQAFLVYGWTGAMAYIVLLVSSLTVGLRAAFARTPWQPYLIAAVATFVGEVAEGFVIDTDHWRHFFLLLGIIWGLAAANDRYRRVLHAHPRAIA
jgi:O-Antigen ligase